MLKPTRNNGKRKNRFSVKAVTAQLPAVTKTLTAIVRKLEPGLRKISMFGLVFLPTPLKGTAAGNCRRMLKTVYNILTQA